LQRLIGNAKAEQNTTFGHPSVVVDRVLKQRRVAANDLLATDATDTGRFQADMFDVARDIGEDNEVAGLEWFVESDCGRGKEITQNALDSKRDSYATHAQAGNKGGNVHTDVCENSEKQYRPEQRPKHPRHHGRHDGIVQSGALPSQPFRGPDRYAVVHPECNLKADYKEP